MEKMDGGSLLEKKPITLTLIIFTFFCFLFIDTKAQALTYCVGCPMASAATCTGSAAAACNTECPAAVVCPTIAAALTCIDNNNDINATIRIAQNPTMPLTPYKGPGNTEIIDNTAGAAQDIDILGGWSSANCGTQTLNPTNTIVLAPMNDRVFLIDNTTNFSLDVTLEGLTITGGDPTPNCAGDDNGGGVCVTSSSGTGGVIFTSNTNIYDDNMANVDGG